MTLHYCMSCGVVVALDLYYFQKHCGTGVGDRACPVCKNVGLLTPLELAKGT